MPATINIAVFISCHGFGHAARMTAVMDALHRSGQSYHFHLFTAVPSWFFAGMNAAHTYHGRRVDVGFVQRDALHVDFAATADALRCFYPFADALLDELSGQLQQTRCQLVVCDIAAAASRAGLKSVLFENFTWQFLYTRIEGAAGLDRYADYIGYWTDRADYHIQLSPVCERDAAVPLVSPVSRRPVQSREALAQALTIDPGRKTVLLSMGGNAQEIGFLHGLRQARPYVNFIASGRGVRRVCGNLRQLPADSGLDHPGMVRLSDVLIAKIGYSTLAEAYDAGTPYLAITRPNYPEMPALEAFANRHMAARIIRLGSVDAADWVAHVDALLETRRFDRAEHSAGDDQCARIVQEILCRDAAA